MKGKENKVTDRHGLKELPNGWYFFKTNSKQEDPWIISDKIKINRILTHEEVEEICRINGKTAQKVA